LPLLGDRPEHVSRVVFRITGLRLPAFCPAGNGSPATADRASGDQLSQRAFIGDPIVILSDARRADGARHPLVASSGSVVP